MRRRGTMILGGGPSGPWGTNSMLWLNSEGERFVNEGNIASVQTAVSRQPAGVISLVTDAKWMKSVCNCGLEHSGPNAGRPQYYQDMLDDFENIESGPDGGQVKNCIIAERGYTTVIKADTLEELAGYLGYEGDAVDTFLASIEHYNELCYAGADTDFGWMETICTKLLRIRTQIVYNMQRDGKMWKRFFCQMCRCMWKTRHSESAGIK